MPTPSDGTPPQSRSGLPPHLDPRGPRRPTVPRVSETYHQAARGAGARPPARPPASAGRPSGRGPVAPGRGRRLGRVLSWVALSMSLVILGLAGVGYLLLQHYNGNIQRISVFGRSITGQAAPAQAPHNAQNILLVGSDSRAGANGRGTGGSALVAGQRSDTIILAHLYGTSDKALFVSIPRDSYVEIPAWTDPRTGAVHQSRHDKINSALAEGGPALLIATIQKLTDIRIDHYVQIDFVGFKNMVNKLGGVDVCLRQSVNDVKSRLVLSAGRHHIDGATALAFVRDRHSFASGDIQRIKNQQQLIGSLIHKVLSAGTLINPLKLNGFLEVATSSLQVDERLTLNDMKNIALRVRGFSSGSVLFTTVPIANSAGWVNGASVVLLDTAADARLFDSLRRDQAPSAPAKAGAPAGALIVPPSAIRVRVYNGSNVNGLARRAFNALAADGFTTTGIPQNRGSGATVTTILYGSTKADSARTLAAALPGSVLQQDPTLTDTLEVVVGSGYKGVTAVSVKGSAPPASAAPVAPIRTAQDNLCAA